MSRLLDRINGPADLKALGPADLQPLASEIRSLIIETVSRNGGHLAPNLGVVELTIALLRTFDPPRDKIVWDVSHQTYAYKILTGRKDRFHTLRQQGGISGFLSREESEYDCYGAGHSGTAISAGLGIAAARDRMNSPEHVVAVVGDGSLGCGISFEAFNNVAQTTKRLIVVLNDNEMSIAANVGAIAAYLGKLLAHPGYNRWKSSAEAFVKKYLRTDGVRRAYYRLEEAVKGLFLRSVIFEEFGLRYIGPIDGHDIGRLVSALEIAKDSVAPIIVHVSTRKGRGYSFAEAHPEAWHGTAPFDVKSGRLTAECPAPTYSEVFGETMQRLAEKDKRVVAITAAMPAGTGLLPFAKRFRDRFFDVGISEEHAVVFAAGLASRGLRPVVAVYSTFSQRAVDCVIHDVCLQNLPVLLCLDRAGIVGDDGPTHHGTFDVALFRSVPNLVFMQPKDEAELGNMMASAIRWGVPAVIRYPRGCGPGVPLPETFSEVPLGEAEVLREGADVQIWALGDMIPVAEETRNLLAGKRISAGIVNPRFICPLDEAVLKAQAETAGAIVTLENAVAQGGFGSAVEECLGRIGFRGRVLCFGWPARFVSHGARDVLMRQHGLAAPDISQAVLDALRQERR